MSRETIDIQRKLTREFLRKRRLNAPVVWLKPQGTISSPEDAVASPSKLTTDISEWDTDDLRNLGVRLVDGFIEVRIKAPDEVFSDCLFAALKHLHADARAAFGNPGVSSIVFRIEDPVTIEAWRTRWPAGMKNAADQWVETTLVCSLIPAAGKGKPIYQDSMPLPGSVLMGKPVVWRPGGKEAAFSVDHGLEDLEARELGATTVAQVVRAIAYATLAYWIRIYLEGLTDWDESLTRTIGGWIARLVLEGQDINARGKSLEGVCWAPVDSHEVALSLIAFLGGKGLQDAFLNAERDLERNPDAHVPSWPAIERTLGISAKIAIRRAFHAGVDIDEIERLSERYVFDSTMHTYTDREDLLLGLKCEHRLDELIRSYANQPIYINGKAKPVNPFLLYATSQLRTDVKRRDFFPGSPPAAILRVSASRGIIYNGEDRVPDEYLALNTFSGFAVKPIGTINDSVMAVALSQLDKMLSLLTQDNDGQMMWLKKFIAWTIRHPDKKQQVCPVIVGGQGIGKSIFGDVFLKAVFDNLAGVADAPSLSDNKFVVTPFIGKLVTFVDEVRLESIGAINQVKRLVRSVHISGQVKYGHQRDYDIWSRLILASNRTDIGLTPEDAADRALFFVLAWCAQNKRMTNTAFNAWAQTLKPFYTEFTKNLEIMVFRQHLMRYFSDLECTREELEDLTLSSCGDEMVVRATMSRACEVARQIIADARVWDHKDIKAWFTMSVLRAAVERVDGKLSKVTSHDVLLEFKYADVIEMERGGFYKFKYGYRTLLEKMGEANNLKLEAMWDCQPDDWGDNTVSTPQWGREWRGKKGQLPPRQRDPDYLAPEEG